MSFSRKAKAWFSKKLESTMTYVHTHTQKLESPKTYAQKLIHTLTHTYKRQTMIASAALLIAASATGGVYAYYQANLQTIYHVSWQNHDIGTVDNPEIITNWIKAKFQEESSKFEHAHLVIDDSLDFREEVVYKPVFDNQQVLDQLQEEFAVQAAAIKVVINGELIGYAADEEAVQQILDSIQSQYVAVEDLKELQAKAEQKKPSVRIASLDGEEAPSVAAIEASTLSDSTSLSEEELPLNEPKLVEAKIKEEIDLQPSSIHPSLVLNEEQLKERLIKSKVEQQTYIVQEGDVLGGIAQKHGLRLRDVLDLNPQINENTLLQIGQELTVEGEEPYITVQTIENLKQEQVIDYEIQTKSDQDMYRGDTRVLQEGQEGKKLVKYKIIKENGKQVAREVLEEEIIKEPVPKIVARGEKVKPSRGTGQFAWPAVGGRISSGFGQRWGKLHAGIDISGVRDRTIKAADNGTVVSAGWNGGYGNTVIINHDNGFRTLYGHLSSISVKKGQVVRQGEAIGVMGSTGNSTGIHLHFEVIKNGSKVNPMSYLSR